MPRIKANDRQYREKDLRRTVLVGMAAAGIHSLYELADVTEINYSRLLKLFRLDGEPLDITLEEITELNKVINITLDDVRKAVSL